MARNMYSDDVNCGDIENMTGAADGRSFSTVSMFLSLLVAVWPIEDTLYHLLRR
jgi:hypothetical protein